MAVMGCDDGDDGGGVLITLDATVEVDQGLDQQVLDAAMDAGAPDAMPDAMPDAAVCGPACAELEWHEGPALPNISDHHTTFVHADGADAALFVVGGIATDPRGSASAVYDTVERAAIGADGAPGPFETEAVRLPFPMAFHGMAQVGDRYYLTGGVTTRDGRPTGNSRAVMLELGPGPRIERAVDCGPMLYGVVHPTTEWVNDRLYVIGGSIGPPTERVQMAEPGADGCPTNWAQAPRLPRSRSHHASVVIGEDIYLLGGFGEQNQEARTAILRSTRDGEGLTGWERVGELDPAPWTASALVLGDTLWLLGGGEGSGFLAKFVSTVRRAPITADGIGAFETVDQPMPLERSHVHQTPMHAGVIYSVGGRIFNEDGQLDSTDRSIYGRLVAPE
jgi:hypothetical protein